MPSTTIYERGQVVVVEVPFSDHTGSKRRPALVLSTNTFHRRTRDVIVCPISSRPQLQRRPGPGDHPLKHWRSAGLRHPSTARISKVLAVDKELLERVLGTVHPDDLGSVADGLRRALDL